MISNLIDNSLTLSVPCVTMTSQKDMTEVGGSVKYTSYEQLPIILTVQDVAEILGISRNNAYYICRSEGFPAMRVGKQFRISKARFIDWINTN